jgi:hypothetical protein
MVFVVLCMRNQNKIEVKKMRKMHQNTVETHLRVEDNFQHAVNLNAFNNGHVAALEKYSSMSFCHKVELHLYYSRAAMVCV